MGVFSYLAARFQYPEVLDGKAQDVLPALLATGDAGRAAWAIYALLPLVFLPAGIGAFEALRERAAGPTRVGALFALLSSFSMMIGLMRWPSVHWELAHPWGSAGDTQRTVLAAGTALARMVGHRNRSPRARRYVAQRHSLVSAIADVNNYLLPAWMIGFGIWLVIASRSRRAPAGAAHG